MSYPCVLRRGVLAVGLTLLILLGPLPGSAQNSVPETPEPKKDNQIDVNWLYGSYVPKEIPLESLSSDRRFKLYIRQDLHNLWNLYQDYPVRDP
jgi:hypothetical protein